ncbi:hypothetical protein MKX01_001304 [Papaver californicum]|nr:hypothetical protein MKX01_001304 [Papaver californicum]
MVKPISTIESTNHTVFIDTNLDTHLALIITNSDTVLHLKKKLMSEHFHCFPMLGKIDVNAIKVKRKKCIYHLSDSMFVKSVYDGVKGTWFLYVDVVCQVVSREENPLHLGPGSLPNLKVDGPSAEAQKTTIQLDHQCMKVSMIDSNNGIGNHVILKEGGLVQGEIGGQASDRLCEAPQLKSASKKTQRKVKMFPRTLKVLREKRKRSTKISDGETGLSYSGVGKDDSTRDVVPVTSKHEKALDADHPTLETKKAGKILPPTGKSRKSKVKTVVAPSSCLEKGSDKDCGIGGNPSSSKINEEPPKEQNDVISKDLNTSTDENRKQENTQLKKVKRSRTVKATSDNNSSKYVLGDGKAGGIAIDSLSQVPKNNEILQMPSDILEHSVGYS